MRRGYFDLEWGAQEAFSNQTRGRWSEFTHDAIVDEILRRAKVRTLDDAWKESARLRERFEAIRSETISLLSAAGDGAHSFLASKVEDVQAIQSHLSADGFVTVMIGRRELLTRDMRAAAEGFQAPPHIAIQARICEIKSPIDACKQLKTILEQCIVYVETKESIAKTTSGDDRSDSKPAPRSAPESATTRVLIVEALQALHPRVQEIASRYVADGHFRAAVHDTYIALDNYVKQKTGSIENGAALMQRVFSANNPILRLSTHAEEQTGFMMLFTGAIKAVRNQYSHHASVEPSAEEAIEWLSFASALFRLVDQAGSQP